MADLKITELPPLTGALLQANDPVAVADVSASETKKITAKDLIQGGIALIDDGSIPGTKVNVSIAPGSIGTTELADGSVTAPKLADSSTATLQTGLPAAGAYIGQLTVNTTDGKAYIWDGAAWSGFKAGGSINQIVGDATGNVRIDVAEADGVATLNSYLADSTGPRQVLIGPTAGAGAVTLRQLIGQDLPLATNTTTGAVQVGGSGLVMNGNQVVIDNSVVPTEGGGIYGVVEYDAQGLVTSGRAITSGDLPAANVGQPGAIQPGTEFTIGVNGTLQHANSVVPGTSTKVTFNGQGHITASQALTEADIPALPASKITSGTFPSDRLANRSVTADKLADYSIAYIQDTQPATTGNFIGELWLNPLAASLRMWDGNVWVPIGVGALSEQNLRFCGTVDASTGLITILTPFGVDAGFAVGSPIPTETEQLTGAYFVVEVAGNNIGVTSGVSYDPGDWCLCYGLAQGWGRIDTLNAGGGGGGSLDSLADVTIASPVTGQFLGYNGTQWVNSPLPNATTTAKGIIQLATQAEADAGLEANKAITPLTLATYVAAFAPVPPDASETERGIIQLATAAEVEAGTDAEKAVTPLQLATYYMPRNIADLPDLP